jgi:serine protease Do
MSAFRRIALCVPTVCLLMHLPQSVPAADAPQLRTTIDDAHAVGADWWVYNNIDEARRQARAENKPIFVTFRCVPCEKCKAFDAEVAQGSEVIEQLASEKFIPVRQVEMKGVDLTQFQFDHDLNWAAMFINADGTVYARYGTQSAEGPDAYNSITGLRNTMLRVLELHEHYAENKDELAGKLAEQKPYRTALEMPGLMNRDARRAATTRRNCIHCHNIHDAENFYAQETGTFNEDMLYRYPLPETIGLTIDADSGIRITAVTPGSPAADAGLVAGEDVTHMNGQAITSIADMQWVLHHVPYSGGELTVTGSDTGQHTVSVAEGWKKSDFSWRGSMWSISPRLRFWMPPLDDEKRRDLKLAEDAGALEVRWINHDEPGGRAALDSGLREGDIIIAVNGEPLKPMTPQQFNMYVKLNYKVGDELPLTVLREGREREVRVNLVE